MIRHLKIVGFKSIHELDLELGVLNCFIGANGVGKSNILEAIGVLGAAANGAVDDEALLRRGVRPGVPRLYKSSFRNTRTAPHISIEAVSEAGATYRVSLLNPLDSPRPAWTYKTEFLRADGEPIVSAGVRNSRTNLNPQAGLAALRMVELEPASAAARLMTDLQQFALYCPNTPTLRGMQADPQSREPVGLAGGGLPAAVEALNRLARTTDEPLVDDLLALIDWAAEVTTARSGETLLSPSVARTQEVLKFTDRYMNPSRSELTAYDASEGALYVLFCAALCRLERSPKVFAIDNLDQALNPRLVKGLVERLGRWLLGSLNSETPRQLLFTAHNPGVLDGLDLTNNEIRLFAVDRNSAGHTSVRRVEMSPELVGLQQQYPLSRLWMMGNLGAVPNV